MRITKPRISSPPLHLSGTRARHPAKPRARPPGSRLFAGESQPLAEAQSRIAISCTFPPEPKGLRLPCCCRSGTFTPGQVVAETPLDSARDLSPVAPPGERNPSKPRAAGTYSLERAIHAAVPRHAPPSPALSPRGPSCCRSPSHPRPRGTYFGGSGQVKRVPPCPNRPSLHHRRTAQPRSRT